MTRTLEIRRHTDNDGDRLTSDGVAAAVRLGGEALDGPYTLAVSSGAQRATQTIACLLAGLGQPVTRGVTVDEGFRSDREDGAVLADALRRTIDLLGDGERALVVGHSPTSEAAVRSLTGITVEPLGKGEAVIVTVDGDDLDVVR